jgi:hypothetical protein
MSKLGGIRELLPRDETKKQPPPEGGGCRFYEDVVVS